MWNNLAKGYAVVVSAPSGAGKTTLCAMFKNKHSDKTAVSRSCTTRARRDNEPEDAYYFLSQEDFEVKIKNNEFIEWAKVHGEYYGTLKKTIADEINNGKIVLLDIDVQGGVQIKKEIPEALMIFVLPPNPAILQERLSARKSETRKQLETRLNNAKKEIEYLKEYDYLILNDHLDEAYNNFELVIQSHSFLTSNYAEGFLTNWKTRS